MRCFLILAFAGFATSALAETARLTPVKDTSIYSSDDTFSNATGDLFCGVTGGGVMQRCLLAFDVAAEVPAGSTITDVTLTLTLVRASAGDQIEELNLRRLQQDWGEGESLATGGGGAPATNGDATWLFRFFPDEQRQWNTPGGDFDQEVVATAQISRMLGPFTWNSAEMISDVQRWLDGPDSNFGWILFGDESDMQTSRRFASREEEAEDDRPTLLIEFVPPSKMDDDMTDDQMDDDQMDNDMSGPPRIFCGFEFFGLGLTLLVLLTLRSIGCPSARG